MKNKLYLACCSAIVGLVAIPSFATVNCASAPLVGTINQYIQKHEIVNMYPGSGSNWSTCPKPLEAVQIQTPFLTQTSPQYCATWDWYTDSTGAMKHALLYWNPEDNGSLSLGSGNAVNNLNCSASGKTPGNPNPPHVTPGKIPGQNGTTKCAKNEVKAFTLSLSNPTCNTNSSLKFSVAYDGGQLCVLKTLSDGHAYNYITWDPDSSLSSPSQVACSF